MRTCHEYAVQTLRYVDNDLNGQELEEFRAHLELCADCQASVRAEQALSQTLNRSRPLYSAPSALRSRVEAQLAAYEDSSGFLRTLSRLLQAHAGWRVLAATTAAFLMYFAIAPSLVRQMRAASYIDAAVTMHRQYLNGGILSGLQSSSPEAVAAWIAGKVPFNFRLPAGANPLYRLTGAAMVNYKGTAAALLMYETQHDKMSLLVDSGRSAVVAGGEEIQFGKLTFHFHTDLGFRVITWTNHGLSYALVSNVEAPAQSSCLVCHQNMADRGVFSVRP